MVSSALRVALVASVWLLTSAESSATTVRLTFTGFGSYSQVEGGSDSANGIFRNMPIRFFGSFTYDSDVPDGNSSPRFGNYAVGGSLDLTWVDGQVCNLVCPGGQLPNTFYDRDGAHHRHHISFDDVPITIYDGVPGDTTVGSEDLWGIPFTLTGGMSQIMSSAFFSLRDFGPNGQTRLTSDALVLPSLEGFGHGSFVSGSRRERACDPAVSASCANVFTSALHWNGQLSTLSVETVPEQSAFWPVVAGLVAVALARRKLTAN